MKFCVGVILFYVLLGCSANALEIGEPAPPLSISKWVKKGPINIADGKGEKVYVIEFWATWCPPCLTSIPHLSKLQKMYKDKDLVVVGISREKEKIVSDFVKAQKDMEYNVGVDKNGQTDTLYMVGEKSIPVAFVVDKKGIMVWKGHPMDLDAVLPEVISGNFNVKEFKKLGVLRQQLKDAMKSSNIEDAIKASEAILDITPEDLMAMQVRLMLFQRQGQYTASIAFMDSMIRKFPDYSSLYFIKLRMVAENKRSRNIEQCAKQIMDKYNDDHQKLNKLAWDLLTNVDFPSQPLKIALEASKKAVALLAKEDKSGLVVNLDTLARCYYAVGRIDKAIATQEKVVKLPKKKEQKKAFEETLDFYKKTKAISDSIK